MNIQILSAGLGTRLKPITDKIPKPALALLNVPMFFYSYHYFRNETFKSKVVNTFHLENALRNCLKKQSRDLKFISDGLKVLGTGGGIANARSLIEGQGNFWVANGDSVFITDEDFIGSAQKIHSAEKPLCTLVVTEHPDVGTKFGGVWVNANDEVLDIGKERPVNATHGYHFTGFRILSDKIFNFLKKEPSELFDALRVAMKEGHRVLICKAQGEFFETGNIEDYLLTTKTLLQYLKENKYPKYLSSLFKTYSPNSRLNEISMDLKMQDHEDLEIFFLDKSFKLFQDCTLEGFLVAGKNVVIKEKCHLKNAVILDDQIISANTEEQNTIIY